MHNEAAHALEEDDYESIDQVKATTKGRRLHVKMVIEENGGEVRFEADSGSAVSTIQQSALPRGAVIEPTQTALRSWTGERELPVGTTKVMIVNPANRKRYKVKFHVVSDQRSQLLSLNACEKMGLISINKGNMVEVASLHQGNTDSPATPEDLTDALPQVFGGTLGRPPGVQHLEVDKSRQLRRAPVRRAPMAIQQDKKASTGERRGPTVTARGPHTRRGYGKKSASRDGRQSMRKGAVSNQLDEEASTQTSQPHGRSA